MSRACTLVRSVAVTRPPTVEPIALDDAKGYLKVDTTADDSLITAQITACRQHVEKACELALMPQEWTEYRSIFTPVIELRGGNVRSVTSVKYLDSTGVQQTLATSAYLVDFTTVPATVRPAYGTSWPTMREQPGSVQVAYEVGYADAGSVPGALASAIQLLLGDIYTNRSAQAGVQLFESRAVEMLLGPWKRIQP